MVERYTAVRPCPVCTGSPVDRRGERVRCHGFRVKDSVTVFCSRENAAGSLKPDQNNLFKHTTRGVCGCGERHGETAKRPFSKKKKVAPKKPGVRRIRKPTPVTPLRLPLQTAVTSIGKYLKKTHVKTWTYQDAGGRDCYAVARYEGPLGGKDKTYRPFHLVGDRWLKNDPKGLLPLYRLPTLADAETVFLFEGEKCADLAAENGFTATASAHGAQSPKKTDWRPLLDKAIVIVPDHGDVGERYANAAAELAFPFASEVKVVPLPGLDGDGDDYVDWRAAGHEANELKLLVDKTVPWTLPTNDKERASKPGAQRALREVIADALVARTPFARDRFGRLLSFKDGAYHYGAEEAIRQGGKEFVKNRGLSSKWSLELIGSIRGWIEADAPRIWPVPHEAIEDDDARAAALRFKDCVSVKNGILNTRTRRIYPHTPEFLTMIHLPVTFDPAATCPEWDKRIAEWFPDDAVEVAWELLAWWVSGYLSIQKAVLLLSEGGSGKGRFLAAVRALLGRENVSAMSLHEIETNRFKPANLYGKLLNACSEVPHAALEKATTFKSVTGGDEIETEIKHVQGAHMFRPTARLVFSANQLFRSADSTSGFLARWHVVPFPRTYRGTKGEVSERVLDASLADPAELSGALNQALLRVGRVQKHGLSRPKSLRDAVRSFKTAIDPFSAWLDEKTKADPDGKIACADLQDQYRLECASESRDAPSATSFGLKLQKLRPNVQRKKTRHERALVWAYCGMTWKAK